MRCARRSASTSRTIGVGGGWRDRIALLVACPFAAAALAGCGGGSAGPSGSGSAGSSGSVSVSQATADIRAADFARIPTIDALADIATAPAAAQAAQQVLAAGTKGAAQWAAVYLYMNTGTDPSVLAPYLASRNLTIRTMAATGEVLMGSSSGFPVLIAMLGQTGLMTGSQPLQPLWEFATQSLVTATAISKLGPPFDATQFGVLAAQKRWQEWWSANRSKLHWNVSGHLWSTS